MTDPYTATAPECVHAAAGTLHVHVATATVLDVHCCSTSVEFEGAMVHGSDGHIDPTKYLYEFLQYAPSGPSVTVMTRPDVLHDAGHASVTVAPPFTLNVAFTEYCIMDAGPDTTAAPCSPLATVHIVKFTGSCADSRDDVMPETTPVLSSP